MEWQGILWYFSEISAWEGRAGLLRGFLDFPVLSELATVVQAPDFVQ